MQNTPSVTLLPGTSIEIVRPLPQPARLRMALLDFDGTLSLIRAGWQEVMADRMVADLLALETGESAEALRAEMMDMIDRTTGQPTAQQMDAFREAVSGRGGTPPGTETCMERYRADLARVIDARWQALAAGEAPAARYLLRGARDLLEGLRARRIAMFLASGTDHEQVVLEADLLGLTGYFTLGISGAVPPPGVFTKDLLVERLVREKIYRGDQILGIGDGPVEIAAVARVDGVAVGVASDEQRPGSLNADKRERLIAAGAHIIVPDLSEHALLLHYLFDQGA